MINKRASIGGWTETILLTMLFVILLAVVLAYMNSTFGGDYSMGLDTSAVLPNGSFGQFTEDAGGNIEGGETTQTDSDSGLSLLSSWSIAKSIFTVIKDVVTGAWIGNIVSMLMLPNIVAIVLKILFFASIIFAVIKLFFKVNF